MEATLLSPTPVVLDLKRSGFERKIDASLRSGTRDAQFKATLLSDVPEDPGEIQCIVHCSDEP